jgi:hypothetical protein
MSMETHVFFRGMLPTKAALNRTMKELNFPFAIKPATGALDRQSGFMPMTLWDEDTGVEFDVYDGLDAIEEFSAHGIDGRFARRASFRWGGSAEECAAGLCTAAALARLVGGIVFDEAENRVLSVDDALGAAKQSLMGLPKREKGRRPRGPTVIKRMLAPLLAKRSDLVLADGLLLIRPVRHLIRGVVFEWHDRGTRCTVLPYFRPLYQQSDLLLEDAAFEASLGHADFEPMLFDALALNAFRSLGQIASIDDFIESGWGKRQPSDCLLPSILLARGIDEAKARVTPSQKWAESLAKAKERLALVTRKQKLEFLNATMAVEQSTEALTTSKSWEAFLARGNDAIFAHYRAWEAAVARACTLVPKLCGLQRFPSALAFSAATSVNS